MDDTDKQILDIIQTGFPIEPRPYAVIGAQVGLTESEALARVRALRGKGIIRRIGANFQSAKIGFTSTLCAASVPPESPGCLHRGGQRPSRGDPQLPARPPDQCLVHHDRSLDPGHP